MAAQERVGCLKPRAGSSNIYVAGWNTWSAFQKVSLLLENDFNYYANTYLLKSDRM